MKHRFSRWNIPQIKRDEEIENVLKNEPLLYHKRKYVISSRFNDSNMKDGDNNINKELLFFQDYNNKQINTFKNKINRKSFLIEENANHYLNYMIKEKKFNGNNIQTEPGNKNKRYTQLIKSGVQRITPTRYDPKNNILFQNYNKNSLNKKNNEESLPYQYNSSKNIHNYNKALSYDENIFLPKITKLKCTDITDNNYYDKITRQLKMQLNKNYLDYNQSLMNKRKSPNNDNKILYIRNNDELTLPPGRILNPNYYNLGESKLSSNPIVNPGNRAPIFSNFRHNKLKSEFVF